MSLAEGVKFCDQHGGNVILPRTIKENHNLQKLLIGMNIDKVWMGMFHMKHQPGWIIGNESQSNFKSYLLESNFLKNAAFHTLNTVHNILLCYRT